ncbi:hypothetical protein [Rhodospirillaceae bacterium SYSU D60014]|uniref:hypothetical protein n=1 Tax=Virgifigura deserti TaxID=2268457 RepID=UPI000E66C580
MIRLDRRVYSRISWAGIALLAVALIVVLFLGRYRGALILGLFLVASIGFVALEDRLPRLFDLLFVAAALLNAAGWVWNLFDRVPGYDEVVHAFSIFAITLSFSFLVFYSVRLQFHGHGPLYILAVTSFGIAVGALWEVIEWLFGVISSLDNTITDLVMDSLGAVVAGLAAAWALGRERAGQLYEREPRPGWQAAEASPRER